MSDNGFWPGAQVRLRAVFTTSSGVEVDPTSVTLYYETPDNTVTTKGTTALTKETTGTYFYLVTVTSSQIGEWHWGYKGTGAAVGSNLSGRFRVLDTTLSTG